MKTEVIDNGPIVICDAACGKDYTFSDAKGGFVFNGAAYCPECAEEGLKTIEHYHEERYITHRCPPNKSFKDFILEVRGGNNKTIIRTFSPEEIIPNGVCAQCKEPFSNDNIFTPAGIREAQISGLCEKCFDEAFADCEDEAAGE